MVQNLVSLPNRLGQRGCAAAPGPELRTAAGPAPAPQRPGSCRQAAYRDRRRAAAAFRDRVALLQIGGEIRGRCEALEMALAEAIEGERDDRAGRCLLGAESRPSAVAVC